MSLLVSIDTSMHYIYSVDAEWLSGRMPDSRAREHRHESSYGLHIGAVDGDSLWRCYAMTTQNHCTCYFVINRDLFIYLFVFVCVGSQLARKICSLSLDHAMRSMLSADCRNIFPPSDCNGVNEVLLNAPS